MMTAEPRPSERPSTIPESRQQQNATAPGSLVLDTLGQVIRERKEWEAFVEQSCVRLTAMREEVRSERAADHNWQEKVQAIQAERDAAHQEIDNLKRQLQGLQIELNLATEELSQVRVQSDQQRRQSADLQQLLEAMKNDIARRDEDRSELQRLQAMAQEHAELVEIVQGVEQLEAELRQQQEAVRRERESLQSAGQNRNGATRPGFLHFPCKHCGGNLEAKEHLAGLVTRCSHCSKMAPVPKLGAN